MDDLQYNKKKAEKLELKEGFKPCYKWMTFNTKFWKGKEPELHLF